MALGKRWTVAIAGLVTLACNGKLLLDRGSADSTRDGGTPDAGSGGSPVEGEGGISAQGGVGGTTGLETGGTVIGGGGFLPGAGGGMYVVGGAGGTMDTFTCPSANGGYDTFGSGGGAGYVGVTAITHFKGNPGACPAMAPAEFSECTTEGTECVYDPSHTPPADDSGPPAKPGWFTCVSKDRTTSVWYQTGTWYNDDGCPAVQPAEGASCEPYEAGPDASCGYPGTGYQSASCWCIAGGGPTWRCIQVGLAPPVSAPSVPNPAKLVKDLTDAERTEWCKWYSCDVAYLGSSGTVSVENGYTLDGACPSSDAFTNNGTYAQLPIEYCKKNLAVSACEATVGDLSDCLLTFRTNVASPGGCGRYFATPGCSGTLAVANDENYKGGRGGASGAGPGLALDCSVRVE